MDNVIIPFNNEPVNNEKHGAGSTYTVPAGRYAKVTISLYSQTKANNVLSSPLSIYGTTATMTQSYWISAGQTAEVDSTGADCFFEIDGTEVAKISSAGDGQDATGSKGFNSLTHVFLYAQEYDSIQ
jgi:hypothetical protein